MSADLRLLAAGLPGLAAPCAPEGLAATHPLWAQDMAELGPWRLAGAGAEALWLPRAPAGRDVAVCGACASTMDVARELAARGALGVWGSVIAAEQESGRGQLRRTWLAAPGNLMATLVCPPAQGLWNDLRPLVLGHLLAEALGDIGLGGVRVKWPNDLLLDDRKIGGMLVEERPGCVLAGFGLNLAWAPGAEALRHGHGVVAAAFPAAAQESGPLALWLRLVNRLETRYETLLETYSPSDFLTLFRSRLAWLGRRVLVREGADVRYAARITGVSERGELVLDQDGREVKLLAGDVTPL